MTQQSLLTPAPEGQLTWRAVGAWYALAVTLGAIGTILAYGPFTSRAWAEWSGPGAWKRDCLRLLLAGLLALSVLWNMGVVRRNLPRSHFTLRNYEKLIVAGIAAVLIWAEVWIFPANFEAGLLARGSTVPHSFQEIYLPYIPYTLYMFGLWVGIACPLLLFLIRAFQADARWSRRARHELEALVGRIERDPSAASMATYRGLVLNFENYVLGLKQLAQRYISVVFVVAIVLLFEQLTPTQETVTPIAVEAGKTGLWLLLGPALLTGLVLVVFGYQYAAAKAVPGLSLIARQAPEGSELFEKALEKRSQLSWNRGPLQFLLSIFQSATFTVALLVAVVSYVFSAVKGGERLLYVLVPRPLIDFVRGLFQ